MYSAGTCVRRRFPQRAFVTRLRNAYVNPLAAPERILRERILSTSEASDKKHLVPRSHNVSQPVHSVRDEDPGRSMRITPSNRSHLKDERSHDISSVVDCKLDYPTASNPLPPSAQTHECIRLQRYRRTKQMRLLPSLQSRHNPVHPARQVHQWIVQGDIGPPPKTVLNDYKSR